MGVTCEPCASIKYNGLSMPNTNTDPKWRSCSTNLQTIFCELGESPLANDCLSPERLQKPESFFPLLVYVCDHCKLVQLQEYAAPEDIFSDYLYFSSWSDSWLAHCKAYAHQVSERFALSSTSHVLEVASNDGYLLQFFGELGIGILGVEPAANVAKSAEKRGVPTKVCFFGKTTAQELRQEGHEADLWIGNNVLAHVPDINDFVAGIAEILKPEGVATLEFPHLLRLIQEMSFDTIYHEHFSYLSSIIIEPIFARAGLGLFDVDEIQTHGGSLWVYVCRNSVTHAEQPNLQSVRTAERDFGSHDGPVYAGFSARVRACREEILNFLQTMKAQGKVVAAHGAPAKGVTLLKYCGVNTDLIAFTVDRSPHKQDVTYPACTFQFFTPMCC